MDSPLTFSIMISILGALATGLGIFTSVRNWSKSNKAEVAAAAVANAQILTSIESLKEKMREIGDDIHILKSDSKDASSQREKDYRELLIASNDARKVAEALHERYDDLSSKFENISTRLSIMEKIQGGLTQDV